MAKLTAAQVRAHALAAGFTEAQVPIVIAIAYQESRFDSAAVGDTTITDDKWGPSIGLMQVRSLKNPSAYSGADAMRIADKLTDPAYNLRVSRAIYMAAGGKFTDWSTFNNRNKPGSGWAQAIGQGYGADDPTTGVGAAVTDAVNGGYENVAGPATAVANASDALNAFGSLASKLQDGQFWKRVGIGAGGSALILIGLLFLLFTSSAAKSAAGTAVGLVPGGGVVKTVAKAARK